MAMKQVARVNALARSALNCMYVQFVRIRFLSDANTSPDKTPTTGQSSTDSRSTPCAVSVSAYSSSPETADLTALDQAIHALADLLRQSGVGAYPLPAPDVSPPTEQELITDTTRDAQ